MMRKLVLVLALFMATLSARSQGVVTGHVLEQDGVVPIEGAEIAFSGFNLAGDTLLLYFYSDSIGYYEAQLDEGRYAVSASAEGYEFFFLADSLVITEEMPVDTIDFILHEIYHAVRYVAARPYAGDMVRVSWSMNEPMLHEDFETGDFSRFHWDNNISDFPWTIDSIHAHEGSYCMKSTCEGVADGRSETEVSVFVPWSGQMSFQSKVSSESPWDAGFFYIDDVQMLESSGVTGWEEHVFDITEGEHVFRWAYRKDALTDEGDDCFYVDNIYFYVDDSVRVGRSFQYYDLLRRRFDEPPVMLASHLTDTVFMDLQWASLDWGKYQWGVSCHYEGNRAVSDTVWSAFLDKAMTTTFEADITTNVGLSAEGAVLTLISDGNQGFEYQSVANSNGHVTLSNVYRDNYSLRVQLDGFVDYVSDSAFSVMEPTHVDVELREAVKGIDSLYVSSTGWAMWELSDTLYRDLQGFEVQLDSVFVAFTTARFFQFDVSALTEGKTYLAQVRPVYLSDTCEWRSYAWVYRSCADFQPTVSGLQGEIHGEVVLLSWQLPENDSVLGAVLYREGDFLAFVEESSFLDETVEMQGSVTYGLRLVYDGEMEGNYYAMSCEENVTVTFPAFCDSPTKLEASNFLDDNGEYGVLISWGDRPEPVEGWLFYDNGEYRNSIGGGNEPVIFWSIRFDAEQLADYQGASVRKITLFDIAAGTYQLWIYKGGEMAPQTLLRSQNMVLTGSNVWHSENIFPALEIPENEALWIVVGQQGLSRPAAVCSDMGNPNGRWVSLNGVDWTDLHTYNMNYTWMLRAFVSDRLGKILPIENDNYILQHYNLYRSYNNTNYQQIASVPAVEGQAFYQYRDVLFGDTHREFYYRLTAVYLSDENETCESDFAASLYDPEQNYVLVDDHWSVPENQENTLSVYPNPAKNELWIEAKAMSQFSVFDALGQCVFSANVSEELFSFDLSDLPDGLYVLQAQTKNGVVTRRFVVSH